MAARRQPAPVMAAAPVYQPANGYAPAPVPSYEVFGDNHVVEVDRSQVGIDVSTDETKTRENSL